MNIFAQLVDKVRAGERVALVTVLRDEGSSPRKRSTRMLVHPDGNITGTIGGGAVEQQVIERALNALRLNQSEIYRVHLTRELGMCCGGAMEFLIEPIEAEPRLIVFGAGHIGQALCPVAASAGFRVTIVDEREEFATPERFADAEHIIVNDPVDALPDLSLTEDDYVVIVTHDHQLDQRVLRHLADHPVRYLGMIGSRSKIARFVKRLEARGIPRDFLNRVRMPIGLDLGAVTPGELAISIAAEMIALRRGRSADACPSMYWRPDTNDPSRKAGDTGHCS